MPIWYVTPAALGYLSQFILALLIAGYFVVRLLPRRADRPAHRVLLTGFFVCVAVLTLLLALEAATSPAERLHFLFPQTTVLALGIVLLLQFTYRFQEPLSHKISIGRRLSFDRCKWEALLVLALSLLYLLYEAKIAIDRFHQITWGEVTFRVNWADYPMVAGLLWAPIVFLRQSLAASARQQQGRGAAVSLRALFAKQSPPSEAGIASGLRPLATTAGRIGWSLLRRLLRALWQPFRDLWRPQGQEARTARAVALVYLLPFAVGLLSIYRSYYSIPQVLLQVSRSLGIMIALAAFAVIYFNHLPETTSFMVRLVGVMLVTLLTALAAVGWLITPTYATQYHPALPDQRTLRFTPNDVGGYDVSLTPLHFESDLGVNLHLLDRRADDSSGKSRYAAQLNFVFPFYGKTYDRVYVNEDGAIALGHNLSSYGSYSYHYGGGTPFLFPLLLDLDPGPEGAGSVRQEPDRLIVTWERVPAFYHREDVYTFQAVLYTSGVFEFSYDGLPARLAYLPDDEPSARAWVIGAVPGDMAQWPQRIDLTSLASDRSISSGPAGLVQDYYLGFRRHLHTLLLPLAYLMLGVSLLATLGFPSLFRLNLVRPLDTLLAGVRRVNAGDLQAAMPIHFRDEIGFLTESFNTMTESLRAERAELQETADALRELGASLETRVADRTRQLSALYDISSIVAQARNPDILLKESLARTMLALQCDVGAIWLMDEKKDQAEPARLRLVAQRGFPPTVAPDQVMTPAADGLLARMAAERQPVLVTDLATDPRLPAAMADLGAHAMMMAPLYAGEQVLGMIGLLRGAGQAFREGEKALLANVADQLGIAVETHQLRRIAERSALLEERQRLARDLHDSVTQSLYSVTLFTQALRSSVRVGNRALTQQYAEKLSETAQQALKEMRWLIYELRPALVEELGLVDAVRRRLEMVEQRAGVGVEFSAEEIGELEAGLENAIYQIAQEALTNILRHAAATFVSVQMSLAGPDLHVEIADNGKGFDLEAAKDDAGIGLASMCERAERLGGSLAITSEPGRGTRIRLTVPVQPTGEPTP